MTRNVEWDVKRIRRLRIKAAEEGMVYTKDDIGVLTERKFRGGIVRPDAV